MLLELLGLTASFLILSASWPQLREVLQRGTEGVSLGSWMLFFIASVVWTVFGWKIESPATLIGNVAAGVAFGTLVGALLTARMGRSRAVLVMLAAVALLFAVMMALPTQVVATAAVLLGFGLALPQLVTSWRTRGLPSTVSTTAWAMIATGQGLWLVYGVLRPELAILIVNVVAGTASVCVLLLQRGRPQLPQDEPIAATINVR